MKSHGLLERHRTGRSFDEGDPAANSLRPPPRNNITDNGLQALKPPQRCQQSNTKENSGTSHDNHDDINSEKIPMKLSLSQYVARFGRQETQLQKTKEEDRQQPQQGTNNLDAKEPQPQRIQEEDAQQQQQHGPNNIDEKTRERTTTVFSVSDEEPEKDKDIVLTPIIEEEQDDIVSEELRLAWHTARKRQKAQHDHKMAMASLAAEQEQKEEVLDASLQNCNVCDSKEDSVVSNQASARESRRSITTDKNVGFVVENDKDVESGTIVHRGLSTQQPDPPDTRSSTTSFFAKDKLCQKRLLFVIVLVVVAIATGIVVTVVLMSGEGLSRSSPSSTSSPTYPPTESPKTP